MKIKILLELLPRNSLTESFPKLTSKIILGIPLNHHQTFILPFLFFSDENCCILQPKALSILESSPNSKQAFTPKPLHPKLHNLSETSLLFSSSFS
jgi:hypothetical protein